MKRNPFTRGLTHDGRMGFCRYGSSNKQQFDYRAVWLPCRLITISVTALAETTSHKKTNTFFKGLPSGARGVASTPPLLIWNLGSMSCEGLVFRGRTVCAGHGYQCSTIGSYCYCDVGWTGKVYLTSSITFSNEWCHSFSLTLLPNNNRRNRRFCHRWRTWLWR